MLGPVAHGPDLCRTAVALALLLPVPRHDRRRRSAARDELAKRLAQIPVKIALFRVVLCDGRVVFHNLDEAAERGGRLRQLVRAAVAVDERRVDAKDEHVRRVDELGLFVGLDDALKDARGLGEAAVLVELVGVANHLRALNERLFNIIGINERLAVAAVVR